MLLALGVLLACGDLSNQVFLDDASFLAALPARDDFHLAYPGADEPAPEGAEIALLYEVVLEGLAAAEGWVEGVLAAVELAGTVHPSERRDDYRRWGPIDWPLYPGTFVDLEMSRSVTGATYSWAFFVSRSGEGTDRTEFLWGSHEVGAEAIHAGSGTLTYDLAALGEVVRDGTLTGSADLAYDVQDLTYLHLERDETDDGVVDLLLDFAEQPDGGGALAMDLLADLAEGGAPETTSLGATWLASGDGRGEVRVSGGDLGEVELAGTQCWGPQGVLLYSDPGEEGSWLPAVGGSGDCTVGGLVDPAP